MKSSVFKMNSYFKNDETINYHIIIINYHIKQHYWTMKCRLQWPSGIVRPFKTSVTTKMMTIYWMVFGIFSKITRTWKWFRVTYKHYEVNPNVALNIYFKSAIKSSRGGHKTMSKDIHYVQIFAWLQTTADNYQVLFASSAITFKCFVFWCFFFPLNEWNIFTIWMYFCSNKSIVTQIWPSHNRGNGQTMIIIWTNLVGPLVSRWNAAYVTWKGLLSKTLFTSFWSNYDHVHLHENLVSDVHL